MKFRELLISRFPFRSNAGSTMELNLRLGIILLNDHSGIGYDDLTKKMGDYIGGLDFGKARSEEEQSFLKQAVMLVLRGFGARNSERKSQLLEKLQDDDAKELVCVNEILFGALKDDVVDVSEVREWILRVIQGKDKESRILNEVATLCVKRNIGASLDLNEKRMSQLRSIIC